MQQTEETDPESESEGARGLRFIGQGRVVELQLLQRLPQLIEVVAINGVQAGVNHGVRVPITAEILGGGSGGAGDRVTHPGLAHVLHPGDQVADLPDTEGIGFLGLRGDHANLKQVMFGFRRHHEDAFAMRQLPVDDPNVGDHATVGVVDGVEDQRPGGGLRVPDGWGDLRDDLIQQLSDADASLGGDLQNVGGVAADDPRQLRRVFLGIRARQVDLVQHRDDVQVGLKSQV